MVAFDLEASTEGEVSNAARAPLSVHKPSDPNWRNEATQCYQMLNIPNPYSWQVLAAEDTIWWISMASVT